MTGPRKTLLFFGIVLMLGFFSSQFAYAGNLNERKLSPLIKQGMNFIYEGTIDDADSVVITLEVMELINDHMMVVNIQNSDGVPTGTVTFDAQSLDAHAKNEKLPNCYARMTGT